MLFRRAAALLLGALLLAGCSVQRPQPSLYRPDDSHRLVIYTSHKEQVYAPIVKEFEERTGIWVEVITGGTSEMLERIAVENANPQADIMFGGGIETLESYREYFTACDCPNARFVAPQFLDEERMVMPFSALPVVLIYNTKLVDPQTLTGWQDLARPEFAGKIAYADPQKSGSSFTALVTIYNTMGEDGWHALAQGLPEEQMASSGLVVPAVADGSCLVGITLEETAMQSITSGDNLAMVYPAEGTCCVPDGTAVLASAPHPENAAAFLDFVLSQDVQQLLVQKFYRRSILMNEDHNASLPSLDALAIREYNAAWAAQNRDSLLSGWAQCRKEVTE